MIATIKNRRQLVVAAHMTIIIALLMIGCVSDRVAKSKLKKITLVSTY